MKRRWLCAVAVLLTLASAGSQSGLAQTTSERGCAAITSDLAAARSAGRLTEVTSLYKEAERPGANCPSQTLFCLGRSAALAHVEAAYKASDRGDETEARRLLAAGRPFGAPWPLLVALGDAAAGTARATHDPQRWAEASLGYQQAVAAFDEPVLCSDEPASPAGAAAEPTMHRMLIATLLASPITFFHDRCAPCALAFLAHGAIDPSHPRAVPITFEDRSAALTVEGRTTVTALADCARALRWATVDVSVHTDERGGEAVNAQLSAARAATLRGQLRADGYAGALTAKAVGKREPLPSTEMVGLLPGEIERANRRVQIRNVPALTSAATCSTADPAR